MNTIRTTLLLCAAAFALAGCGDRQKTTGNYIVLDGFALGTTYHISVNAADTAGMAVAVDSVLAAASRSMSLYDPASLLSRLNRNETDSVDAHIAYCVELAARVSAMSGGVYDITVAPLTEALGFAAAERDARPDIDSLMRYVGYRKITVENGRLVKELPGIRLDLNSIAKGYAVDLVAGMLASRGASDYLAEVGGEVVARGVNPQGEAWSVGIDLPREGNILPGDVLAGVVRLRDAGLATSGNYRRYYTDEQGRRVVHTIDASTGESRPSTLLSATVVAENCATADALATMLMALGLEKAVVFLQAHPEYGGYLIYDAGRDEDGRSLYGTWHSESLAGIIDIR